MAVVDDLSAQLMAAGQQTKTKAQTRHDTHTGAVGRAGQGGKRTWVTSPVGLALWGL